MTGLRLCSMMPVMGCFLSGCISLGNSSLIERLASSDEETSKQAAEAFSTMNEASRQELRGRLASALNDPDWAIRGQAVLAAGSIAAFDAAVMPLLFQGIGDPDARVRAGAILGFENMKAVTPHAMGQIIKALTDKEQQPREAAAQVLERLDTPEAKNALSTYRAEEDRRFFGWRRGDKATLRVGLAVGNIGATSIRDKKGMFLVRRTQAVKKIGRTTEATVIESLWDNWGVGTPAHRTLTTYTATRDGVSAELEVLDGKDRGDRYRYYIAKFPISETTANSENGTVIRRFGTPEELMARNVPDSECILVKVKRESVLASYYVGEYQTYCKDVGLVSFSDAMPDLDAGVPGTAATYVAMLEKFEAGPEGVAASGTAPEESALLPKSLRGKVLTGVTRDNLENYPGKYKNKLVLINGMIEKAWDAPKKSVRFGLAKMGNVHGGWGAAFNPGSGFEKEERLQFASFVLLKDANDGRFVFGFVSGMELPQVGARASIVARYLGNVLGTIGSHGAPVAVPGVYLEAKRVLGMAVSEERTKAAAASSASVQNDATRMSLDELNQYLQRGKSGKE